MRRLRPAKISMLAAIAITVTVTPLASLPTTAAAQTAGKTMTTPSGLQIIDATIGTGASPKPGQICVMHYTGWLYEDGKKGKKFDSSLDRNEPFEFPIGQRKVIAGWDEGVATMKVGGKRTLIIGLWRSRCGRRHSSKCDADVRCRTARREIDEACAVRNSRCDAQAGGTKKKTGPLGTGLF